jgi:hypothetical protein
MKGIVISVHTDDGYHSGLVVSDGAKYLGVIWPDSAGIRINKIEKKTARYTVLEYNLNKVKKTLRRCGRSFGITKGARIALKAR